MKKEASSGPDEYPVASYYSSEQEVRAYRRIESLMAESPVPRTEMLGNLGLYLTPAYLARVLFMERLYRKILDVHGFVAEFGVRWGPNLALFSSLRTIFEPHNHSRRVLGFDTFDGCSSPGEADGDTAREGLWGMPEGYEQFLQGLLRTHEELAPRSNLTKFEVIAGDVMDTLPAYLDRNPETIFALAYLNLDLYQPTRRTLELLRERMPKGGVIAFNELAMHQLPGETIAVLDTLDIRQCRIQRDPIAPYQSYIVIE